MKHEGKYVYIYIGWNGARTQLVRDTVSNLSISFLPYTHFLIVVGVKASGKTYYTIYICKSLLRLIAIDPTWQLSELGYVVHYPDRIKPAFLKWKRVVFQPMNQRNETYNEAFKVLRYLLNYTLVIDEIDKFTHGQWYISEDFKTIVRQGRSQGIGLIGNTRRPSLFHLDIRDNADFVVCFHLHGKNALAAMSDWMGVSPEEIKGLKKYWSWRYTAEGSKVCLQRPCQNKFIQVCCQV